MEQQDRQGEYHDQTEDQVQVFLRLHFVRRFGSSAGPVCERRPRDLGPQRRLGD